MRKFWRIGSAAGRRLGLLMLAPALLLCAGLLAGTAYAADSTYLFEVTTGAATGHESKIDFFIITYTTADNKTGVSKLLFPKEDAWTNTYQLAYAADQTQSQRDEAVMKAYGYSGAELNTKDKPIFQPFSTDQYLFTTDDPIDGILRVQVFATNSGNWSCQGMRIFRVDQLGGLYRYNTASNDCYIDFEGDLIAEATPGSANVAWKNDKLVSTSTGTDISLRTSGFDASYAHHSLQDNSKKTFALRLDFADVYGAGLESLGAMSTGSNTLRGMGLAETLAVTVYYNDIYGLRRTAKVPGVLNAAEYTAGLLGGDINQPISGLAQQGEEMVIGIFLPEFASLRRNEDIILTLGASEARAALGGLASQNGGLSTTARQLRTNRTELSESDTASFVTMALYDLTGESGEGGVQISASVSESSGSIRYVYSGDPLYYQPVEFASGALLSVGDNRLSLRDYEHGKLLAPRDKTERYLIELTTDDALGAGTKDDIMMSINWTDLEGNKKESGELNVRTLSRDFNGWWCGSAASDPGYYRGVARGQTLRLFVPIKDVKTITDVKVWMSSGGTNDDWQMKDLTISTVSSYDKRAVVWQGYSVDGVAGSLSFTRNVVSTLVYRFTNTAANPVLVQQESNEKTDVGPGRAETGGAGGTGGGGVDVTSAKKVDWSQIRYSMTYQQASQNLYFGKERFLYAVTVNVGKDADALASDGDCGSKNLFYFRLVFRNANSGFVLANQQLSGDAFISGASQTFYISTNEDYGDVTAVQIIPEDLSENSDMFDKLNIESIEIKRESSSALVPVWTVSNVGWISIDYRDEGQMGSVTGMAGRGAAELTRTYTVDGSTFDVNLMLAIQTEGYSVTEGYPEGGPQFVGNLAAVVYYDSYSPSKGYSELSDVTRSMYSYMNRTSASSDKIGGKTVSDPNLMFRPDHTDRFFFSLSDVHSIKRIEFQAYSEVNTTWKIKSVSLFVVNGDGSLIINKDGEYERVYREGEGLTWLASSTSENSPAYQQYLQAYDESIDETGRRRNAEPATINVNFTENSIEINAEAKQWTSVLSREPVSENDTLNVFLYPQEDARVDPIHSPVTTIQYTTAKDQAAQISTGDMNRTTFNGQTVFYAVGLNAKQLGVLNSVVIYSGQGSGIRGGSVRGVVQQLRSGVVIKTWELENSGYTDVGGISLGTTATNTTRRQRVQLQMGADVTRALLSAPNDDLTASGNNLAVALWYRGDDPSGMELRSPYVYLTDQGYTELRPGQVIDLTFEQKNIAEITGISIVATGDVSGSVEAGRVLDEEIGIKTGTAVGSKGEYGFTNRFTIANVPYRMNRDELSSVKRLSMTFTTARSALDSDVSAGTSGPVRMTVGYFDRYGDLVQKHYEDVRPYISDGEAGFLAGSTVNVEMLLPDVAELRWVELEPYSEAGGAVESAQGSETIAVAEQRAIWTLEGLTVTLGEGEFTKHSDVKTQIIEGTPLRLYIADILVAADVYVSGEEEAQTVAGGSLDLLIPSGDSIRIDPRIIGSYEGFTAMLMEVDTTTGAFGRASLDDTRGYTAESIAAKAAAASDSREAAIWNSTKPQTGTFEADAKTVSFTPPRNYTDKSVQYQIRVASAENASSVLTINVTVKNESDPVAQQLDELAKLLEREALQRAVQQAGGAGNRISNDIRTSGTGAGE